MEDLKKHLNDAIAQATNDTVIADFEKLTAFIDGALAQAFKLSGDERANFLVSNLLNMRDYMSTAVVVEKTRLAMEDKIINTIDSFFEPPLEVKKKEQSSEVMQQKLESSSVTDQ